MNARTIRQLSIRSICLGLALLLAGNLCRADAPPKSASLPKQDSSADADVRVIRDIAYRDLYPGEDAKRGKNKLDLYLPKSGKDFPVLLFVHGGAWMHGDKNQRSIYRLLGQYWARHGVATVVTNYRLSPGVKHPEHEKDVARAFAWTYHNIASHGGRPDQIFVSGHSAGGHLVALLATDETYLKAEGIDAKVIKGVIPISGVYRIHGAGVNAGADTHQGGKEASSNSAKAYKPLLTSVFKDDAAVRNAASPINHVRRGLPPFLVMYADKDLPLLGDMAREFSAALQDKKCEVRLLEVKDRNHMGILVNSIRNEDPVAVAVQEFIHKHSGK